MGIAKFGFVVVFAALVAGVPNLSYAERGYGYRPPRPPRDSDGYKQPKGVEKKVSAWDDAEAHCELPAPPYPWQPQGPEGLSADVCKDFSIMHARLEAHRNALKFMHENSGCMSVTIRKMKSVHLTTSCVLYGEQTKEWGEKRNYVKYLGEPVRRVRTSGTGLEEVYECYSRVEHTIEFTCYQ